MCTARSIYALRLLCVAAAVAVGSALVPAHAQNATGSVATAYQYRAMVRLERLAGGAMDSALVVEKSTLYGAGAAGGGVLLCLAGAVLLLLLRARGAAAIARGAISAGRRASSRDHAAR
jgi:hypothetical protein